MVGRNAPRTPAAADVPTMRADGERAFALRASANKRAEIGAQFSFFHFAITANGGWGARTFLCAQRMIKWPP